jgi:hypothetical protein
MLGFLVVLLSDQVTVIDFRADQNDQLGTFRHYAALRHTHRCVLCDCECVHGVVSLDCPRRLKGFEGVL